MEYEKVLHVMVYYKKERRRRRQQNHFLTKENSLEVNFLQESQILQNASAYCFTTTVVLL